MWNIKDIRWDNCFIVMTIKTKKPPEMEVFLFSVIDKFYLLITTFLTVENLSL